MRMSLANSIGHSGATKEDDLICGKPEGRWDTFKDKENKGKKE